MLTIGDKAPDFNLADHTGQFFNLASFAGKQLVLYFYPKDDTPGCTIESQAFSSALPEFEKRAVQVVGISGGDNGSKERFCSKYDLRQTLLSDTDFAVANAYGVFGEKKFLGNSYMGIHRTTFVISSEGLVLKVFESVKPETHTEEVLAFLDGREYVPGVKVEAPQTDATPETAKPKRKSAKKPAKKPLSKKRSPKKAPAKKAAKSAKKSSKKPIKKSSAKKKVSPKSKKSAAPKKVASKKGKRKASKRK